MIIDVILDRKDGEKYSPSDMYRTMMEYSGSFNDMASPITRAMDYGTEADVKKALCDYIRIGAYNPAICDYINSQRWL